MIAVNFGTLCHIFTISRSPYRESLLNALLTKKLPRFLSRLNEMSVGRENMC